MWSVLVIAACITAPPLDTVEDLPKLLGEEFDLLQALDTLDEDKQRQEKRLMENQAKRIEVIARRDRAAKRHSDARATLESERDRIRRRIRNLNKKPISKGKGGAGEAGFVKASQGCGT